MRQKNEYSKGTKRICVISIRCRLPIYRGHLKKGKFTHVKPIYSGSIRPSDENSSGWPFLNQRAVHRDVILRQKLLLLGQCQHFETKKTTRLLSCSSSLSRFLENTEWSHTRSSIVKQNSKL